MRFTLLRDWVGIPVWGISIQPCNQFRSRESPCRTTQRSLRSAPGNSDFTVAIRKGQRSDIGERAAITVLCWVVPTDDLEVVTKNSPVPAENRITVVQVVVSD
jgi:hypothetical protein